MPQTLKPRSPGKVPRQCRETIQVAGLAGLFHKKRRIRGTAGDLIARESAKLSSPAVGPGHELQRIRAPLVTPGHIHHGQVPNNAARVLGF